ncbi:MAG: tetratricopeptide repeat protein [Microbacter sp.]
MVILTVSALLLNGCTTSKNTWLTRNANAFATRYNIYFNAYQSFLTGLDQIDKAQQDRYDHLIPMFPISVHENARAGASSMDNTIEECRKAIKNHSIKVKPERNYNKLKDPAYLAFLNQTEFNPMVVQSWLLLADAEFYKADFTGAIGTYTYVLDHFGKEMTVKDRAEIGVARCYTEMNAFYQAEDALNRVSANETDDRINGELAAATADLMIRKGQLKASMPFLKIAVQHADNGYLKQRFLFLLGQISLRLKDYPTAYEAFSKVISFNPPYKMEFAARLLRAQSADPSQQAKTVKTLKAIERSPKNKDYLDQVEVTLGDVYLSENKPDLAIEAYKNAILHLSSESPDNALPYLKLADLYFARKMYIEAQPYYAEAAKRIKQGDNDFQKVIDRSTVLDELASYYSNMMLQDSLQHLARLPESERIKIISKMIAAKKSEAAREAKAAVLERRQVEIAAAQSGFLQDEGAPGAPTAYNTNRSWYFYNPMAVEAGKAQFRSKWGNRTLADNWRISLQNLSAPVSDTTSLSSAASSSSSNSAQLSDSVSTYLAQLPLTSKAMEASNQLIGNDLLQMAFIYETKLADPQKAVETLQMLGNRFPADSRWLDGYYALYLLYVQQNDSIKAAQLKQYIITHFPDSKYAMQLKSPLFAQQKAQESAAQDSLYQKTFEAFINGKYDEAMSDIQQAKQLYSFSPLMPKFDLLNAVSLGRTGKETEMKNALQQLIAQYPESDAVTTAKNLLALLEQGKHVPLGGSIRSSFDVVATHPVEMQPDTSNQTFSTADNGRVLLLIVVPFDTINVNELLYKIAAFNFTHFVLNDFDLQPYRLGIQQRALIISDFNSYEDAYYYLQRFDEDAGLTAWLTKENLHLWIISDDNWKKILGGKTIQSYFQFYQSKLLPAVVSSFNQQKQH